MAVTEGIAVKGEIVDEVTISFEMEAIAPFDGIERSVVTINEIASSGLKAA